MISDKVSKGVRMLQGQGHLVEPYGFYGKNWWQNDDKMLATPEEIEHIADGIYSLADLEEIFIRRRLEEFRGQL